MKAYTRKFTPEAKSLLRHLAPHVKANLRALTDQLLLNPHEGKKLHGELLGYYAMKHHRYRVIYEVNDKKHWVIIHYVGHRNSVYELFSELVKKSKRAQ